MTCSKQLRVRYLYGLTHSSFKETMGFDPYGESDPSDPVRAWSLKFKAEPKQGVVSEG